MRPVRNKRPNGVPKTPGRNVLATPRAGVNFHRIQESVEVYCRIKPCSDSQEVSCIDLQSPKELTLIPPETVKSRKLINYTFNHIFTEHADQRDIFESTTLPLLRGFIEGESGLLFTYGVTGSGKTYTMCGEGENPGIVPRCIYTLFNSIGSFQYPKFLVKSDRMNGFEVQGETDALEERLHEAKMRSKTIKKSSNDSLKLFTNDGMKVDTVNDNLSYSVFVTYVEIYNNLAYDLLDESASTRSLQHKILREDANKNMYVNNVTEIEVKSAEDALDLYLTGGKRKRMGQTNLNAESSRSHSVFSIRLVIGNHSSVSTKDPQHQLVLSQLSMVDLAGSERCSRTQIAGLRLKEAGCINNSLMVLRNCLEILRENQHNGTNRMVPYRESRLTHLFKNYFEGEGKVRMIVCVNPSPSDYEETVHVMKFAEMTQEVKVLRPELKAVENILKEQPTPFNEINRMQSVRLNTGRKLSFICPDACVIDPESDKIRSLITFLKRQSENNTRIRQRKLTDSFRLRLVNLLAEKDKYEEQSKYLLPAERAKNDDLKLKLQELQLRNDELQQKLDEKENDVQNLQKIVDDKDFKIKQAQVERAHQKRKLEKMSDKITHQYDKKLRYQRDYLTAQMKSKAETLELVKDIVLNSKTPSAATTATTITTVAGKDVVAPLPAGFDEDHTPTTSVKNQHQYVSTPRPAFSSGTAVGIPSSEHVSRRDVLVSNPRYRRSRSTGDMWLEHKPANPVPLGTVFQPMVKCRKSVTKLTNLKDVVNSKQSKYMLISQGADDEGDLETKLYKGDIIPTCSGGAQVIFDDVEKLKQESPTGTPKKVYTKRDLRVNDIENVADKCKMSLEGHSSRSKLN